MSLKKMGVVTVALAGAGALCARHMKAQLHESGAKACPCMPGTTADEGGEQQREHGCSQQEVRDAA